MGKGTSGGRPQKWAFQESAKTHAVKKHLFAQLTRHSLIHLTSILNIEYFDFWLTKFPLCTGYYQGSLLPHIAFIIQ